MKPQISSAPLRLIASCCVIWKINREALGRTKDTSPPSKHTNHYLNCIFPQKSGQALRELEKTEWNEVSESVRRFSSQKITSCDYLSVSYTNH